MKVKWFIQIKIIVHIKAIHLGRQVHTSLPGNSLVHFVEVYTWHFDQNSLGYLWECKHVGLYSSFSLLAWY